MLFLPSVLWQKILSLAFHHPQNSLVSLVCRDWRRDFGGTVFHVLDGREFFEYCKHYVSDPSEEGKRVVVCRQLLAHAARNGLFQKFEVELPHLLEVDGACDFANGFLLEAAREHNFEIFQIFYRSVFGKAPKKSFVHMKYGIGESSVSIYLDRPQLYHVPQFEVTMEFEIPFFYSPSRYPPSQWGNNKKLTTVAVYLNDRPIVAWFHTDLSSSEWICQAIQGYIDYIRYRFMGREIPDYIFAYVEKNDIKLNFRQKNVICVITNDTQTDLGDFVPQIQRAVYMRKDYDRVRTFYDHYVFIP